MIPYCHSKGTRYHTKGPGEKQLRTYELDYLLEYSYHVVDIILASIGSASRPKAPRIDPLHHGEHALVLGRSGVVTYN